MQTSDGALIGQKGVLYGLQKPSPGKQAAVKKQAPSAARQPPSNVFGDEDSEEDNVEAQISRQADKKRSAAKVQQMYESALADDPTAFDYDGVYDSIQEARTNPRIQEKLARQSKYIIQLKEQAEQRKREQDIRFERQLLKERAAEDALYDGKEKFVTSAYRKKLEEDKKWELEQKRKDEADERNDARKLGHMHNFYSNLLTKNVAMGAQGKQEVQRSPSPAPTAGTSEGPGQPAGSLSPGVDQGKQDVAQTLNLAPGKAPVLDKYDLLRIEAEKARKQQAGSREQEPAQALAVESMEVQPADDAMQAGEAQTVAGDGNTTVETVGGAAGQAAAAIASQAAGKRRNDESTAAAARERYLARKKQQLG